MNGESALIITIFQIIQCIIIGVFTLSISDTKQKPYMMLLIDKRLVIMMKLSYIIPIVVYGYTLVTLQWVSILDLVALLLTFVGTSLVIRSKLDLGQNHTWTGFHSQKSDLITTGIYRYIRHPLYTGIYLVISGALFTLIPHTNILISIGTLLLLTYIMIFLAVISWRETKALEHRFGEQYKIYRIQVHPFLPIRRFPKD